MAICGGFFFLMHRNNVFFICFVVGVIAIATIFLLSLLQPFGIDQMGKQRMLLIVCGTLLTILSSSIAFVLIGRKKWNGVRGLLLFVVSLSGRPSTGCSLQLFQVEKSIPVARSYTKDFTRAVTQK
jgi:hypothetical protein